MKAWLVWRAGTRGQPSPALHFDNPPGPEERRNGPRVLATVPLPYSPDVIEVIRDGQHYTLDHLAELHPPPEVAT